MAEYEADRRIQSTFLVMRLRMPVKPRIWRGWRTIDSGYYMYYWQQVRRLLKDSANDSSTEGIHHDPTAHARASNADLQQQGLGKCG